MSSARDHLLRTLASVAPGVRVLDLRTGAVADLARLGFDVWACGPDPSRDRDLLAEVLGDDEAARRVTPASPEALGYGDASFDWAVIALAPTDDAAEVLCEVRRVLKPGAWVWVAADAMAPQDLADAGKEARLAIAEPPVSEGEGARAVFRRVEEGVGL